MKVKWVVQSNLGSSDDIEKLCTSCDDLGIPCEKVRAIPFSDELPDVAVGDLTVFYGSTNFIGNIYRSNRWTPGVYFDEDTFKYSCWQKQYGERLLNSNAELITIKEFAEGNHKYAGEIFVRPDEDSKAFAGEIVEPEKFKEWCRGISSADDLSIKSDTRILIAEPVRLEFEWRLFVVDKRVSSGSQYRQDFRMSVCPDVPQRVVDFVESLSREWVPSDVFVMDIAESGGELFVIEINCMNSCGFYANDVQKIVQDVSRFIYSNY